MSAPCLRSAWTPLLLWRCCSRRNNPMCWGLTWVNLMEHVPQFTPERVPAVLMPRLVKPHPFVVQTTVVQSQEILAIGSRVVLCPRHVPLQLVAGRGLCRQTLQLRGLAPQTLPFLPQVRLRLRRESPAVWIFRLRPSRCHKAGAHLFRLQSAE